MSGDVGPWVFLSLLCFLLPAFLLNMILSTDTTLYKIDNPIIQGGMHLVPWQRLSALKNREIDRRILEVSVLVLPWCVLVWGLQRLNEQASHKKSLAELE